MRGVPRKRSEARKAGPLIGGRPVVPRKGRPVEGSERRRRRRRQGISSISIPPVSSSATPLLPGRARMTTAGSGMVSLQPSMPACAPVCQLVSQLLAACVRQRLEGSRLSSTSRLLGSARLRACSASPPCWMLRDDTRSCAREDGRSRRQRPSRARDARGAARWLSLGTRPSCGGTVRERDRRVTSDRSSLLRATPGRAFSPAASCPLLARALPLASVCRVTIGRELPCQPSQLRVSGGRSRGKGRAGRELGRAGSAVLAAVARGGSGAGPRVFAGDARRAFFSRPPPPLRPQHPSRPTHSSLASLIPTLAMLASALLALAGAAVAAAQTTLS